MFLDEMSLPRGVWGRAMDFTEAAIALLYTWAGRGFDSCVRLFGGGYVMRFDPIMRRGLAIGLSVGLAVSAATTPAGADPDVRRYREFTIPTSNSNPIGITAGRDGNLWFTENNGSQIGRITTAGTVTGYPVPTP